MIKQIAWNTFKITGDITTFLELTELENIQKNVEGNQYGDTENKGNNNS